ncbi:hypothetical protein BG000_003445 [Podila horticola]|nr:hypothetical protein BG000_003445 [Podila horticola]
MASSQAPSPTIVSTENIDSPNMIQSGCTLPNPFLDDNTDEPDDDEQLDAAEEDENNGQDFLLPDRVEREFNFVGELDGFDLSTGFKPFFADVKKKACISKTPTKFSLQQDHFGTDGLAQIREKMLKYWHTADVATSRNTARAWLDLITDKSVDKTTVSGKSRTGTRSQREPDLMLELKDKSNKTLCELGIDLARIGLGLKDALDLIQDKYAVDVSTLVGYQVIAQTMSIYLMRRCGNMYVMVHVHDVLIPDSMNELATVGAEYKTWFELALTVESGIKPVLTAAAKGRVAVVHPSLCTGTGDSRFHTVSTPELNKLLKRA